MSNLAVNDKNSDLSTEKAAPRVVSVDHLDLIVAALEKLLITATGKLNYDKKRIELYAKSIIGDLEKLKVTFDDIARAFGELKGSGYKGSEYGGLPTSRELIKLITFKEKPAAPKGPEGFQEVNFKYEVITNTKGTFKRVKVRCDGGCGRTLVTCFPDEYHISILKNSTIQCRVCEKLVLINKEW